MENVKHTISLSISADMKDREVIAKQLDAMKKLQNPFGEALWQNILDRNKDRSLKKKKQLELI